MSPGGVPLCVANNDCNGSPVRICELEHYRVAGLSGPITRRETWHANFVSSAGGTDGPPVYPHRHGLKRNRLAKWHAVGAPARAAC